MPDAQHFQDDLRIKERYFSFRHLWTTEAGLTGILLSLLFYLLSSYLLEQYYAARILSLFFISMFFLSGIISVYHRPYGKVIFVLLGLISVVVIWIDFFLPEFGLKTARVVAAMLTVGFLIILLLRHSFSQGAITYHRICGAVAVYLLMIYLWSDIYFIIFNLDPGGIRMPPELASGTPEKIRGAMIYFSVVTITTLGYGDILPVSASARLAVMLQALLGQLYPSVMLAWLVSMEILTHARKDLNHGSVQDGRENEGKNSR